MEVTEFIILGIEDADKVRIATLTSFAPLDLKWKTETSIIVYDKHTKLAVIEKLEQAKVEYKIFDHPRYQFGKNMKLFYVIGTLFITFSFWFGFFMYNPDTTPSDFFSGINTFYELISIALLTTVLVILCNIVTAIISQGIYYILYAFNWGLFSVIWENLALLNLNLENNKKRLIHYICLSQIILISTINLTVSIITKSGGLLSIFYPFNIPGP